MVFKPFKGEENSSEKETQLHEIDNPLFKFIFPKDHGISNKEWDSVDDPDSPFKVSRLFTERQDSLLDGKSNHGRLNTVLAQRRESQVEALLNLFNPRLPYSEYANFSTTAERERWRARVFGSVESLHNDYHGNCGGEGGGGHMSHVPVAAFDPVFWLHHWSVFSPLPFPSVPTDMIGFISNIDRIVAIWQGVNTKSWVPEQRIDRRQAIDSDSLLPFRSLNTDKPFWTSKDVEPVESFGYTYPEIEDSPTSQDLAKRVFRKYRWSSQAYNRGARGKLPLPEDMKVNPLIDSFVFRYNTGNLESRLSTEFEVVTNQQISQMVAAPTMSSQQILLSVPEPKLQTAVNIAPLGGLAADNQSVVTKDSAPEDKDLSHGPPNSKDQELLSGKPQGTDILRQWYIDTLVKRCVTCCTVMK